MISIVVCSRMPSPDKCLASNIAKTCGIPYEVVWIDNSDGRHSIFSAYNEGIGCSHGEIVCFVHEDVKFHTNSWGAILAKSFASDDRLGIIGIFGLAAVGDNIDFRMWSPHEVGHLVQGYRSQKPPQTYHSWQYLPSGYDSDSPLTECVFVDGMFMAIRREALNEIGFDSTARGFHLYDFDISMQAQSKGWRVAVSNEILIEHFSPGNFDKTFAAANQIMYDKWKGSLPMFRGLSEADESKARAKVAAYKPHLIADILSRKSVAPYLYDPIREYHGLKMYLCLAMDGCREKMDVLKAYLLDPDNPLIWKAKAVWRFLEGSIK